MASPREARSYAKPEHAAAEVAKNPWGRTLARFGLVCRGVIYLIVGYLVVRIALSSTGAAKQGPAARAEGPGAVHELAAAPGGKITLGVLAVGLAGFSVFSLLDAIRNHNQAQPAARRWAERLPSAFATVLYVGFCAWTVSIMLSPSPAAASSQQQSGSQETDLTARALSLPGGSLIVGAVGVALVVSGVIIMGWAAGGRFAARFDRSLLGRRVWLVIRVLGTAGHFGRGLAVAIIGAVIFSVPVTRNPGQAQGLDGSLRLLAGQWYGRWLLFPVAVGLIMYGVYLGFEARYRRI